MLTPFADADEAGEDVEGVLKRVEGGAVTQAIFEEDFLAAMLVLRDQSPGEFDAFRSRIKKLVSIAIWEKSLKRLETAETGGLSESEVADAAIKLLGGIESVVYTRGGFWLWSDGDGHWSRLEFNETIRKRIQAAVPRKLLTAKLEGSALRILQTSISRQVTFDRPPSEFAINVQNGTLHWEGGWVLKEHNRGDMLTGCLPLAFAPSASAPLFSKFLDEIFFGDADAAEKRQAILAMIGYTLTPSTKFEKLVILKGERASNGKSTLLTVLQALLGDNNYSSVTPESLTERFKVAALHGKLANIVAELPQDSKLPANNIKAIASGDPLTAEYKGKDAFSFHPFATLWIGTNHMPFPSDYSPALFERTIVIGMNRKFDRSDSGGTKAVRGLSTLLIAELPGILNMALEAFAEVIVSGEGIPEPTSSKSAKKLWRQETDPVSTFAEDVLQIVEPGTEEWKTAQRCSNANKVVCADGVAEVGWPQSHAVHRAYKQWCEQTGTVAKLNQQWLTKRLEALFPHVEAGKNGRGERIVIGILIDRDKAGDAVGLILD